MSESPSEYEIEQERSSNPNACMAVLFRSVAMVSKNGQYHDRKVRNVWPMSYRQGQSKNDSINGTYEVKKSKFCEGSIESPASLDWGLWSRFFVFLHGGCIVENDAEEGVLCGWKGFYTGTGFLEIKQRVGL